MHVRSRSRTTTRKQAKTKASSSKSKEVPVRSRSRTPTRKQAKTKASSTRKKGYACKTVGSRSGATTRKQAKTKASSTRKTEQKKGRTRHVLLTRGRTRKRKPRKPTSLGKLSKTKPVKTFFRYKNTRFLILYTPDFHNNKLRKLKANMHSLRKIFTHSTCSYQIKNLTRLVRDTYFDHHALLEEIKQFSMLRNYDAKVILYYGHA